MGDTKSEKERASSKENKAKYELQSVLKRQTNTNRYTHARWPAHCQCVLIRIQQKNICLHHSVAISMWKFCSTNQRAPHNSTLTEIRLTVAHTLMRKQQQNRTIDGRTHRHASCTYEAMTYNTAPIHARTHAIHRMFEKVCYCQCM